MLNIEDTEPVHSMVLSITEPLWLHRGGYSLLKQISNSIYSCFMLYAGKKLWLRIKKVCNMHERDFFTPCYIHFHDMFLNLFTCLFITVPFAL